MTPPKTISLEELARMLDATEEEVNDWLHANLPLSERARYHTIDDCDYCLSELG